MQSGLAVTPASSLSTLGWILSGPMDLWQSIWGSMSLTAVAALTVGGAWNNVGAMYVPLAHR